jgi:hypothetical protein
MPDFEKAKFPLICFWFLLFWTDFLLGSGEIHPILSRGANFCPSSGAHAREWVETHPGPPETAPEGSSGAKLARFCGYCDFIFLNFLRAPLI